MKKCSLGICFTVLLFGFLGCSSAPVVQTESNEPVRLADNTELSFDEFYELYHYGNADRIARRDRLPKEFTVRASIQSRGSGLGLKIALFGEDNKREIVFIGAGLSEGLRTTSALINEWAGPNASEYYPQGDAMNNLVSLIEPDKEYIVFIRDTGTINPAGRVFNIYHIEGFPNEGAIAQQVAERRSAQEAADRYEANNFILLPNNFRPSRYNSIDLFAAVVEMERASHGDGSGTWLLFNTRQYVSDVTFVAQEGTNIVFSTDDGAIIQLMKINSRSGLSTGQKVRLYYSATKNPFIEFTVEAIERR